MSNVTGIKCRTQNTLAVQCDTRFWMRHSIDKKNIYFYPPGEDDRKLIYLFNSFGVRLVAV